MQHGKYHLLPRLSRNSANAEESRATSGKRDLNAIKTAAVSTIPNTVHHKNAQRREKEVLECTYHKHVSLCFVFRADD
jgi:hypothetical protein